MLKLWFCVLAVLSFVSACSDPTAIIHESSEKSESLSKIENCIRQSPCLQSNGVRLWYSSTVIKGEEEIGVTLVLPQSNTVDSAFLAGEDMNMGYIPVFFEQQEHGVFHATTMVGLCTTQLMQWKLTIKIVDNKKQEQSLAFPLYVIL
ncbi:hypothetical protein J8L98_00180 [Pseudoalteromonas sp. MMG013]|uniref:hypothetical protein n=1 Tax=Pseudoalteromonas sp. MMG013 TaxID=2822687 RepID=UPI001B36F798|nr:hypothetical protein [Pseudoalteromonas sp. MMG013]MBQ4860105.1 hypothetical protein [Pseudoalteromonas sp. MMG013]